MTAKREFKSQLKAFVDGLDGYVSTKDGQWTVKGFIDVFQNVYAISFDTKIISKMLEIHLFPKIMTFAKAHGYKIVLAKHQNYYPDISFVKMGNEGLKFAVDFKTTYRNPDKPHLCNGFTLGSHGKYFADRTSAKNVQFPYGAYSSHLCLGIIYNRADDAMPGEAKSRTVSELHSISSVVKDFQFFVAEKWRIAGDKSGSGNTANIGSINNIADILNENGMFSKLGESWFNDYWVNYNKITIPDGAGGNQENHLAQGFCRISQRRCVQNRSETQPRAESMKVKTPPIKSQGIKTKLVPWIGDIIPRPFDGLWVEPFMGTGVVAFNLAPGRALLCDTNPHIVNFYQAVAGGEVTPELVREFLHREGERLLSKGETHYYEIRERFNSRHHPLDFLFLNRAGFNGMIRFNRKGQLNTPFCRKPQRFARGYVTKIANQVAHVARLLKTKDVVFKCQTFEKTIAEAGEADIIYCDPPYIDRHADYYNGWDGRQERILFQALSETPSKFILSTWHHNDFRENAYIDSLWRKFNISTRAHFYHIGGRENNRNPMVEAVVTNYDAPGVERRERKVPAQSGLFESHALAGA